MLTEDDAATVIQLQKRQFAAWNVLAISPALLESADSLLRIHASIHGLRTLDAIQLAAHEWIAGESESCFASADNRLCRIAESKGWKVFNPATAP